MNTKSLIFPNQQIQVQTYTDSINEGISTASLDRSMNSIKLDCNIVHVPNTHAFCGMEITLPNAMDLTNYDTVRIQIDVEKSRGDTTLLYLVNSEAHKDLPSGERANMRTVFVDNPGELFSLPLKSLSVPSWWLLDHPKDPLTGSPNFDNVTKIRITSGDSTFSRQETFIVTRIEFVGKLFSSQALYLTLLVAWICLSFFYGFVYFKKMKDETKSIKHRSKQLESVNRFLNIEKDRYQKMASTDPLTGVLNRAGASEAFEEAFNVLAKQSAPSTLILMDLDDFKELNDTHGHYVGDEILKKFAQVIKQNIRATDYLIRWGGEEFAVISINNSLESAKALAEKLKDEVEQTNFVHAKVTCSFGVSQIQNNIEEWFNSADMALYESKRAGKNTVNVGK